MAFISNGTTVATSGSLQNVPAPTNSQILTGVASVSVGGVGSYAFGSHNTNGTSNVNSTSHKNPGTTHSGSQIIYCNAHSNWYGAAGSGTWRCMGYGYQYGMHTKATVYLRIS
jgi:hypothetical protein